RASTLHYTNKIERCMSVMQSGTQMVKLKNGSKGLVRLFYLDEHRSCIRWRPSRKSEKAKITIDSLYKVTEGRQSDIFHRHADGNFDSSCCFTIYHGNHMESLDLVTSNAEEARTWVTGLRYLMAGISDEDSLWTWMKQTFEEADKNGDGLLNIDEIYQLLHKMNVNLPRRKVKQMFQEADTDDQQGTLTFEEFSVFYRMMSLRRDLFLLLMCFSEKKDQLTAEELGNFLRVEQKMPNVTAEYCLEIIDKFEVSEENKQKGILGIEGFTNFMRSPACDVFNPLHNEVNQDMDQPLCNYFVASSHNTYLTGDQLLSHSKTDMYAWVLQAGCRCVEVDCWDGPDGEPMVQHGYTLTSKITFKSVIETINKYAFVNNEYPIILSIENHCSIQQQKKIAQHLKEIFKEKLDVGELLTRDSKQLPSPNSLKGKILIKGKRLPSYLSADAEEGEVSDDDSADEIEDDFKLKNSTVRPSTEPPKPLKNLSRHSKSRLKCQSVDTDEDGQQEASGKEGGGQFNRSGGRRRTMKLSRDLSDLVVFTNSVVSQECLDEGSVVNVLSFSETRAQQLVHHRAEQFLTFNQRQLSRIYPSAYRIDSSNFNPQTYWNVGSQLVALNYQTEGRMMQLNKAKFMVNGGIGYVLKPPPMCKGSFNPYSDDPLPAYPKKQLVLKIISGQQLPKPPDSMLGDRGEIIDPFVEVEIIGLPVDCCKEQTRVVDDNGFNPVWEETLSFTLHMPEITLVRFLVWDHDPIGRDFVGQRTVAFSSLMPGYRHVYLEGMTEASIFVHISVHDIYGKWSPLVLNPSYTILHFLGANKGRQLRGFRGLFSKSSKCSVDTHIGVPPRKRSISNHLLRRTASAPAKGRKKTKMALSETALDRDRKDSNGDLKQQAVERRVGPRMALQHRPASMPLDKLLQSRLTLSSPETDGPDPGADTIIGELCNQLSSFITNLDFQGYLSSLSEQTDCHLSSQTERHQRDSRKNNKIPDTAFPTSSSGTCALSPLPPTVHQSNQQSQMSLQDSALSRLIDAVSLGNGYDTCGSISALIGQFEVTAEQSNLNLSSSSRPSKLSIPTTSNHLSSTPLKMIQESPQKVPQPIERSLPSSPETTESAAFTILDEEVLSPVSMYDCPDRTLCNDLNTPSGSSGSLPNKLPFGKGTEGNRASDRFLMCHGSASSSLMEIEINVDGDPLDISMTLVPSHEDRQWNSDLGLSNQSSPLHRPTYNPSSTFQNLYVPSLSSKSSYNSLEYGTRFGPPKQYSQSMQQNQALKPTAPEGYNGIYLAQSPSPCKSKSLGDLTSEDISCNFQSKYKVISRSFITPAMRNQRQKESMVNRSQSTDPLTEQLRKLVTLEEADFSSALSTEDQESPPPFLSRRLSSRSQSRVRHIASRARERQQEAFKRPVSGAPEVVLRNKPVSVQNLLINRHSTGSYIAGYLEQVELEDRGLPEGSCTTLHYSYRDQCYADDAVLPSDSCPSSEPEVYFLLRL
uniref:Phosphoinositide phospholipase C n=1 Tax=Pygocentrus nattereri TaxID=42514 RepID=A0AAR2LJE3_PYGNA